jgi:hypothetical protein
MRERPNRSLELKRDAGPGLGQHHFERDLAALKRITPRS